MPADLQTIEPLLVGAAEAARLLGVGRTMLYQMMSDGSLGPTCIKIGRRRLWSLAELREWVRAEPPCPNRGKWLSMRAKNCAGKQENNKL